MCNISILACPTDAQLIAHPWAYLTYYFGYCPMGTLSLLIASTLSGVRAPFTVAYHNLDAESIPLYSILL